MGREGSDKYAEARRILVDRLKMEGFLWSDKVYQALLRVPREEFVPEPYKDLAYDDRPLPIGYGQTISAPSIVAYMTEMLELDVGMKVLEVGTGSGYQAAIIAEIVAPTSLSREEWGHVYTIERIPELAEYARRNLSRTGYAERVTVIVGDGSKGYPSKAPYDRIIVTAAAPKIPHALVEQLSLGGRMVIPIGGSWNQTLMLVEKSPEGEVREKPLLPVLFVPLIGEEAWPG